MFDVSSRISIQETLIKNKKELEKEIKSNNVMLKQDIETKLLPYMEALLIIKIDVIIKIVEKEKAKNHCKQRISSNMSVASSSSSEPPSNLKQKATNIILT